MPMNSSTVILIMIAHSSIYNAENEQPVQEGVQPQGECLYSKVSLQYSCFMNSLIWLLLYVWDVLDCIQCSYVKRNT